MWVEIFFVAAIILGIAGGFFICAVVIFLLTQLYKESKCAFVFLMLALGFITLLMLAILEFKGVI